jgi:hypothetical protein
MKEKRIYIVSTEAKDGELYSFTRNEIFAMNDEDFMEEAEAQGNVWSGIEYLQASYNLGEVPDSYTSVMRII